MKTITDIEEELQQLVGGLQAIEEQALELIGDGYTYEKIEPKAPDSDLLSNEEDDYYGFGDLDQFTAFVPSRNANCFYYTLSDDNKISYELGNNQPVTFTGEYNEKDDIERNILLNAYKSGVIGILNDVNKMKNRIEDLKSANNESEVKNSSQKLNADIESYNNNLETLEVILKKPLLTLVINNSLLPLPQPFLSSAVQVASHVPNREGTYRRSQASHQYHETDEQGVDIILKMGDGFDDTLIKDQVFLTVQNNEIVYYDQDKDEEQVNGEETEYQKWFNNRKANQYVVCKKNNRYFIHDLYKFDRFGNKEASRETELTAANLDEINKINQKENLSFDKFKKFFQEADDLVNDTSLYTRCKVNKVEQKFALDIDKDSKDKITVKINNKTGLINQESWAILEAIARQTDGSATFSLKSELNEFGNRVVEKLADKGETYNVGANASRIDKIIQYTPSKVSSVQNNKTIVALKDSILDHKNKVVSDLVDQLEGKSFVCLNVNAEQLRAKYPCLIVTFNNINIQKDNDTVETVNLNDRPDAIPEGYSEFVTQMMIAQINLKLQEQGLSPLIDRRQSFGFLTPTLTDVHTGVRLSIGLTPNDAWKQCVVEGIVQTDKILQDFSFLSQQDAFLDKFRGGEFAGNGYKYLQQFYQDNIKPNKDTLKTLIAERLDRGAEQTIPLLTPTASNYEKKEVKRQFDKGDLPKYYNWDGKGIITCYPQDKDNPDKHVDADKINYYIAQNIAATENIKLTARQEGWLLEAINNAAPGKDPKLFAVDENYRILYNDIMSLYKKLLEDENHAVLPEQDIDLEKATREWIITQGAVVNRLLSKYPLITEDTSEEDSDDEYARNNYYTPAGMGALFAPLLAAKLTAKAEDNEDEEVLPFPYGADKYAYFELGLSWNKTLAGEEFVRADLVKEKIINGVFKNLLEAKEAGQAIFNKDDKVENDFYQRLIDAAYQRKLDGQALDGVEQTIDGYQSIDNKKLNAALAIISKSFPRYLNQKDMNTLNHPVVYYIDNNPCVNKDTQKMQTSSEILKELCSKEPYPKVLVLDTTSSTRKQIKEFLSEFNKQDKIPVLVTASSMVKHSELGLDLWQGGENKAYLSRSAKIEDKEYFQTFAAKLKQVTRGTESGLGRNARRWIRETYSELKGGTQTNMDDSHYMQDVNHSPKNQEKPIQTIIMPPVDSVDAIGIEHQKLFRDKYDDFRNTSHDKIDIKYEDQEDKNAHQGDDDDKTEQIEKPSY